MKSPNSSRRVPVGCIKIGRFWAVLNSEAPCFFLNRKRCIACCLNKGNPWGVAIIHQESRSRKIWFKVKIKIKRVEINNWEKLKRLPPAKKAQTGMAFSGHVNRMPQQSLVPHSPLLLNSFLLTMTGKMSAPIDNNTPARVLFVTDVASFLSIKRHYRFKMAGNRRCKAQRVSIFIN